MANIYRVQVDNLMDYGKNWKPIRKNMLEYKDDHNEYYSYIYETSFDDCITAIKNIVRSGGIENPECSIYKWKTLKHKTQRWTVSVETMVTMKDEIKKVNTTAVITEYQTY